MHSKFTPFEIDKLNEGKLLQEVNHDMASLQQSMMEYAQRYGAEAEKAKAVLSLGREAFVTGTSGGGGFEKPQRCGPLNGPFVPADPW